MLQVLRRSPASARLLALASVALLPCQIAWAGEALDDFERFTGERVGALRTRSEHSRTRPEVLPGPEEPLITYRVVGDEFETEVERTGVPEVPFVGVLHYTEHVFSCDDVAATSCVEVASRPVTEIFRYQNGSWGH